MELILMDNGHTKIKITKKALKIKDNINYINALMALYVGSRINENSRYVYYEIYADAINRRK